MHAPLGRLCTSPVPEPAGAEVCSICFDQAVRDRGPGVPAPDVRGVHAVAVLPRQAQSGHAEPAAAHLPLLPRRHLPASGGHQAKAGDDDDEEEEGEGRLESPRHRRSHRSVNLGSSSSSLMGSIASSIGIKIIDDRRIGRADAAAREGQGQQ
ncbi:uncharacterized protein LOC123440398 [Hordeum vulgare subsp. vulgare]|uniref:uncharacterized protein LOC123440398 n=1 Tax=Hordeum vulgare subsp. vulgare TaxID=112509 RepID=UPI001D1A3694|nr:uncharacterized protein LOC123440398 [Hordeum vulgare subsp. vulgare]